MRWNDRVTWAPPAWLAWVWIVVWIGFIALMLSGSLLHGTATRAYLLIVAAMLPVIALGLLFGDLPVEQAPLPVLLAKLVAPLVGLVLVVSYRAWFLVVFVALYGWRGWDAFRELRRRAQQPVRAH